MPLVARSEALAAARAAEENQGCWGKSGCMECLDSMEVRLRSFSPTSFLLLLFPPSPLLSFLTSAVTFLDWCPGHAPGIPSSLEDTKLL